MTNETLVIEREFNCSAETLFDMWTQPEHLANWWAPAGFTTEILNYDLKPGGVFHYKQKDQDGNENIGLFKYVTIDKPNRLEFTSGFADEAGNLVKPGFHPDFPQELHNLVVIEAIDDTHSRLHTEGKPLNGTEAEVNFFTAMHDNMKQGFEGTYHHLDQYLATLK
ncbi:SRPBCC domain-containing protein [Macrococcus capreoli]|uniref:SRPBCC family protein n=1 Tax=Macrococcus capreoli TaxID=2982690 RepID=UPI0021D5B9D9|nr:SRPBCC domain-containing protein [Macrococcus sp. TMW 2.2395]MCU7556185.1 SRPBCC domain-containing protein [Macrococcus sp. TMW 2.2395]